jgi:hypothetical protein
MDYDSNGRLLQLIECIESIKSDVKKKMMLTRACDPHTKVTRHRAREIFFTGIIIRELFSSKSSLDIRDCPF